MLLQYPTLAAAAALAVPPLEVASLPVLDVYDRVLTAHPVQTRCATAAILALAGDALAQREPAGYDPRRAVAFVIVEVLYRGIMQLPILLWIIATFHGSSLCGLLHFMFSRCLSLASAAVLEQVLFNQFVVSPVVYYPLYFVITGPLQGLSCRETFYRARTQFGTLFGCNLCFWFPVQMFQFAFVPGRYKVPFICLASFVWSFFLSMLSGSVTKFRTGKQGNEHGEETRPSLQTAVVVLPTRISRGALELQ